MHESIIRNGAGFWRGVYLFLFTEVNWHCLILHKRRMTSFTEMSSTMRRQEFQKALRDNIFLNFKQFVIHLLYVWPLICLTVMNLSKSHQRTNNIKDRLTFLSPNCGLRTGSLFHYRDFPLACAEHEEKQHHLYICPRHLRQTDHSDYWTWVEMDLNRLQIHICFSLLQCLY